ncbi:L-lysine exporter family protein LysE/ArgO [Solibacillus kalamii]|uniref:Lysine transporter LysE n=1 Tax=Solibacillus kalamii TaxID=1748298 RepID=A0ABX3ZDI9_9BACL|nr:LysE/ArgO family amino acid transporter [Solibacillus kalamii]MBM7666911.1 L-lysine exporter family protein LysE/ArgO [Solibacillus kalamii]OUZ37455.1 lysine transporter LysE [Solibacillus kalamii]
MQPLIHGILLAFGLILPLGVQNVFIFNQGATHRKFTKSLPAIVTAGVCDTILIYLAVAGVSVIVFSFEWLKISLFLAGFFFLAYMGWVIWKDNPSVNAHREEKGFSARRQIAFAASVSLLNPHAILDTIGVIGTSSLAYTGYEKWMFTLACIVVSWIWFLSLAIVGRKIGQIDGNGKFLNSLNKISAIIIWIMALYIGYQFYLLIGE